MTNAHLHKCQVCGETYLDEQGHTCSEPVFREFEKGDWAAYSGCESEKPLIANFSDQDDIVIDDIYLELHRYGQRDECWSKRFKDKEEARTAAECLISVYENLGQDHFCALVKLLLNQL